MDLHEQEKPFTYPHGKGLCKRNFKGETLLHLACKRQNLAQVKALIKSGIDINCPDFAGWTALHEAAATGDEAMVGVLLRAGALVNSRSMDGDTPLHDAASSGSYEVVKLLLQFGANPQDKNMGGLSPLHVTDSEAVRGLLRHFHFSTAPVASCLMPHSSTAPPVCENVTSQKNPVKGSPRTALRQLLSQTEEKLIQMRSFDTETRRTSLWNIHTDLTQAMDKQRLEKDKLVIMAVPDCLHQILKSQLMSLASHQAQLLRVIQKQMKQVENFVILSKNEQCSSCTASPQDSPSLLMVTTFSHSSTASSAQSHELVPHKDQSPNICVQKNQHIVTTAPSTETRSVEHTQNLSAAQLLESTSDGLNGLILLMKLQTVHIIGNDELVPNALVDQCWDDLKSNRWSL